MRHLQLALVLVACTAAIAAVATAETTDNDYWNQLRGPSGDGNSPATNLPVDFGESKNVVWKTAIHDEGWSSPVVWGNQIWLTTAREDGS